MPKFLLNFEGKCRETGKIIATTRIVDAENIREARHSLYEKYSNIIVNNSKTINNKTSTNL